MGGGNGPGAAKYHTLDVLRGVAAVWVFVYHLGLGFGIAGLPRVVRAVFERGYLGVPMFFVISGYCLLASSRGAARRGESARSFLYRRWLRIYPPFWFSAAVLLSLPFLIELLSSLRTGKYTPPVTRFPTSALEWASILSMGQVFRSHGQDLHEAFGAINSVYWTLAIEVQFYLVVALALACGRRGWVVFTAVTAASVAFALVPSTFTWGIFFPYWPMFALGLCLYCLLERGWAPAQLFGRPGVRACAVLLPAAVVGCWAAFVFTRFATRGPDSPSLDIFLFALLFAGMLWLGHPFDQAAGRVLVSQRPALPVRLLLVTGAMSYSIYLLHTKLCYLVMVFVRQVATPGSAAFFLGCVAGTLLLCYPFYRSCEKPFMRSQGGRPKPAARLRPGDPAGTDSGRRVEPILVPERI